MKWPYNFEIKHLSSFAGAIRATTPMPIMSDKKIENLGKNEKCLYFLFTFVSFNRM